MTFDVAVADFPEWAISYHIGELAAQRQVMGSWPPNHR